MRYLSLKKRLEEKKEEKELPTESVQGLLLKTEDLKYNSPQKLSLLSVIY